MTVRTLAEVYAEMAEVEEELGASPLVPSGEALTLFSLRARQAELEEEATYLRIARSLLP